MNLNKIWEGLLLMEGDTSYFDIYIYILWHWDFYLGYGGAVSILSF